MARSRRGLGKVERQGQGKINVRLKQGDHNYNSMGFDTIEINLVYKTKGILSSETSKVKEDKVTLDF